MTDQKRPDKTSSQLRREYNNQPVHVFETYEPEWIDLQSVVPQCQPWFWPGIVPDKTITLFGGVGGIGKSLLLLFIAAKTTTGETFRAGGFEHAFPQGHVLLLSAEDEIEYQIKPKLMAMEANMSRLHVIKSKIGKVSGKKYFLELDKDLHILEQKITELGADNVRLIIIDPVSYFLGSTKDHLNSEVANFLNNLKELARKYNLAILLNKHLRKHASGSKGAISAASEVGGSGAWTNTPRKCWLITSHHDDENIKIISQMKDNLSKKDSDNLAFKIMETSASGIQTTTLQWLDKKVTMTADEAVSKQTYENSKLEATIEHIYSYLEDNGQSLLVNIQDSLLNKGVKKATFLRAYPEFEKRYANILTITRGIKGAKMYQIKK